MIIRTATINDLKAIANVEAECFPSVEAATYDEFRSRLKHYADHFLLMFDGDRLIAFVDGLVTDEENLTDDMYANASLHNESGKWQMIFGVNTIPAYRKHGYAGRLIQQAIDDARLDGSSISEGRAEVVVCQATNDHFRYLMTLPVLLDQTGIYQT